MRTSLLSVLAVLCTIAVKAQIITTVAGTGVMGYTGDGGAATAATFHYPWSVAAGPSGTWYVSDFDAHVVRKVSAAGIITTVAGNGSPGYTGDNGPATLATLNVPRGISVDGAGTLFIADQDNNVVRKVSALGNITTFAGTGTAGFSGDGGQATAARLSTPQAVLADNGGNVYVTDVYHVVRKINSLGVISTIVGTPGLPGYSGDGGAATAAMLNNPAGMAKDGSGNLYIADSWNNVIRMVTPAGIISTVAGNGTAGYAGDGNAATAANLNRPRDVAVDQHGNLYIADQVNNVIRIVNPLGIISTFAGTSIAGYSGDGGLAIHAQLNVPPGIAVDTTGKLYIADNSNGVVRKVGIKNHAPVFLSGSIDSFKVCENTAIATLDTFFSVSDSDMGQNETWTLIAGPYHGMASIGYSALSACDTMYTTGMIYVPSFGFSGTDTLRVTVSDGNAIDTITVLAIIKPIPDPGVINGPPEICIGGAYLFTDSMAGGVWTVTNANASVSSTGVVTALAYGMDTINYTRTIAGCTSDTFTTVSVLPANDSIIGTNGVCVGFYNILTGIPPGGTWSSTTGSATVAGGTVLGVVAGPDTISYTVSNVCGNTVYKLPITVNDIATPFVAVLGIPGLSIKPGQRDSLYLYMIGGSGSVYTYEWQLNGHTLPGVTSTYYISDTLHDGDSVTCIVSNGPCSTSTFAWAYLIVGYAGVSSQYLADNAMVLVPNPNNGRFRVTGKTATKGNDIRIEVTNMLGQVVYQDAAPVINGTVNREVDAGAGLVPGMYMVHLATDEGTEVIRFEVMK